MIRGMVSKKSPCVFGLLCFVTGLGAGYLLWGYQWNVLLHGRNKQHLLAFDMKSTPGLPIEHVQTAPSPTPAHTTTNANTLKVGPENKTEELRRHTLEELRRLILEKHKVIKDNGMLVPMEKAKVCTDREEIFSRCADPKCNGSLPPITSPQNLESILRPVKAVGKDRLREVVKMFNVSPEMKEYVFVTGASADHFDESQAGLQTLHQHVLPHLTNFSFYYYDLGLTDRQRQLIRDYSGAELRSFPFDKLPAFMKYLKCYTWKPLIVLAHLQTAKYLMWLDTSIRFKKDVRPYFQKVSKTGILLNRNKYHMPQHVSLQMFDYFGDQACQFSTYGESEAGFLVIHNEPFIWRAIIEPWSACALDHNCMCPQTAVSLFDCPENTRKYSKCHRYDQATMGYITVKVLRENRPSIFIKEFCHAVITNRGSFLLDLEKAKKAKKS